MENNELRIIGLLITDITKEAGKAQNILTKYGCTIRTRLGLHESFEDKPDSGGLILLELCGSNQEMDSLQEELSSIEGVQVQNMVF